MKNGRKFSKWVENTVGKEEISCYEQFFLFPQNDGCVANSREFEYMVPVLSLVIEVGLCLFTLKITYLQKGKNLVDADICVFEKINNPYLISMDPCPYY